MDSDKRKPFGGYFVREKRLDWPALGIEHMNGLTDLDRGEVATDHQRSTIGRPGAGDQRLCLLSKLLVWLFVAFAQDIPHDVGDCRRVLA